MKQNHNKIISLVLLVIFLAVAVYFNRQAFLLNGNAQESTLKNAVVLHKPKYVRGIHLSSWTVGSPKRREAIEQLLKNTELNTVVIDIKECAGEVYIPGVDQADKFKATVIAIPDIKEYLADLKNRGIYPVARMVVFKDTLILEKKPDWGVRDLNGNLWKDHKGNSWVDPYAKEAWDYNLSIAEKAVELGFEEIQFDYIRFPSDGNISTCRYSHKNSAFIPAGIIVEFLKEANQRLKPKGANISIDVFGLTTSSPDDMGIGQKIVYMSEWVDFVSPMIYPSHYAKGEYGIADPNKSPYLTVFIGIEAAKRKLGQSSAKLRPYLQDFSLGQRYGTGEVLAQIQACYDNDIGDWLLWNPRCVYTESALKSKEFSDIYEKKEPSAELLAELKKLQRPAAPQKTVEPKPITGLEQDLSGSTSNQQIAAPQTLTGLEPNLSVGTTEQELTPLQSVTDVEEPKQEVEISTGTELPAIPLPPPTTSNLESDTTTNQIP